MKSPAAFLLLAVAAPVALAEACDLHYRISADYAQRRLDVVLRLKATTDTILTLTPSWAGADHAQAVLKVEVAGQALAPAQGKARWSLTAQDQATVRYTLQGADLAGSHEQQEMYRVQLGDAHFQAFGYGLLLLPESATDDQPLTACFEWHLPGGHGPVFNSHGLAEPATLQRVRASPVQLRHAVYAGGPAWRLLRRELPVGGPLHLAARGHFPQAPDDAVADDAARLIGAQRRFWQRPGDAPVPAQWLLLTPNHQRGGNQGGTLVERAAVLHAPPGFSTRSEGFEHLIAHENLHQWLPERFGARGPGGQAEVPMYWFSEGFTDFFTHRMLLHSGHWTLAQYGQAMTRRWREHLGSAALRLPVADIAPRFFSDRVAGQQMYLRGEWLALRWEAQLARKAGAPSLATLMRQVLLPAGHDEKRLGSDRLLSALAAHLGDGPARDVQRFIVEGQPLTFDDVPAGPCLQALQEPVRAWQLGFDRASFGTGKVQGVIRDGAAFAAGLRDGMALAGYSVHGGDTSREAVLRVRDADGSEREIRYLPLAPNATDQPAWRPLAGESPLCAAWKDLR